MDVEEDIKLACAITEALTQGSSLEEIARLQVIFQTVTSLLTSELNYLKTKKKRYLKYLKSKSNIFYFPIYRFYIIFN